MRVLVPIQTRDEVFLPGYFSLCNEFVFLQPNGKVKFYFPLHKKVDITFFLFQDNFWQLRFPISRQRTSSQRLTSLIATFSTIIRNFLKNNRRTLLREITSFVEKKKKHE